MMGNPTKTGIISQTKIATNLTTNRTIVGLKPERGSGFGFRLPIAP